MENGNGKQEMPGEGHHAMYRLFLYQNALRSTVRPFGSAFCQPLKHSNRALKIN